MMTVSPLQNGRRTIRCAGAGERAGFEMECQLRPLTLDVRQGSQMSAWLTVYCTRPVAPITSDDLRASIAVADMHTNAEVWGIDDEAVVDEALSHLRVENVTQSDGVLFHLRYAGQDQLPIVINLDKSPAGEMLDELNDDQRDGASRVRTILQDTVGRVALSNQEVLRADTRTSAVQDANGVLKTRTSGATGFASAIGWWTVERFL